MTPTPLTDEARQRLASLGYVSAVTPPQDDGCCGPRSETHGGDFEQLLDGNRALAGGRPERRHARRQRSFARSPAMRSRSLLGTGRARARAESRGDGGVQGLPRAGAAQRRCAPLDRARGAAPRRSRARARGRGRGPRARSAAHERDRAPRRTAVLDGPCGRGHRVAAGGDPAGSRGSHARSSISPICWRTRGASPRPRRNIIASSSAEPRDGRALTGLGVVLAATDRLDRGARTIEPRTGDRTIATRRHGWSVRRFTHASAAPTTRARITSGSRARRRGPISARPPAAR